MVEPNVHRKYFKLSPPPRATPARRAAASPGGANAAPSCCRVPIRPGCKQSKHRPNASPSTRQKPSTTAHHDQHGGGPDSRSTVIHSSMLALWMMVSAIAAPSMPSAGIGSRPRISAKRSAVSLWAEGNKQGAERARHTHNYRALRATRLGRLRWTHLTSSG